MTVKMPQYSIVSDRTAEKEAVTNGLTYQKGALTLHALRELIGRENFQKGIKEYYATYFNASATTRDFIKIMEKVSKKDLTAFFDKWLYQPGY